MTDYHGYQHYHASPYASNYLRDDMEYNGYNSAWVIGRERGASHIARGAPQHHSPGYGHDAYHHDHSRSQSRTHHYKQSDRYHRSEYARLAWPTEIPVKLRVALCCEECRWKLDEDLRDVEGVYDVGISGWSNALVTVTGTASAHKILERARRSFSHAELWSDSTYNSSW